MDLLAIGGATEKTNECTLIQMKSTCDISMTDGSVKCTMIMQMTLTTSTMLMIISTTMEKRVKKAKIKRRRVKEKKINRKRKKIKNWQNKRGNKENKKQRMKRSN